MILNITLENINFSLMHSFIMVTYAYNFLVSTQKIKVTPQYQARIKGSFTSLSCNATNFNRNSQIYRWKLNDTNVATWNIQIQGRYFENVNVRVGPDTIGTYTCYVEDASRTVQSAGHGYLSYLESEFHYIMIVQ